jgi:hypothetical protein
LVSVGCVASVGAATAIFVLMYWQPLQMRRGAMSLPVVAAGLRPSDLGLLLAGDSPVCQDVPPAASPADLQQIRNDMRDAVRKRPKDLCAGNRYRTAIKYLSLRQGRFAIAPASLPPQLAAIAATNDSSVAEVALESDRRTVDDRPDAVEPAELFRDLASKAQSNSPETQLQLGLSYVDLMLREGGRETKARLSSHSIEALSSALKQKPYLVAALYARGLNYLYWPVIAGRLPAAIADLKACIALPKQLRWHPHAQIFAAAYVALGDTYVKLSEMSLNPADQRKLLAIARLWWQDGLRDYPGDPELEARLSIPSDQLGAYVESARAIETYINTDLNLLWIRTETNHESRLSQP